MGKLSFVATAVANWADSYENLPDHNALILKTYELSELLWRVENRFFDIILRNWVKLFAN